MLKLNDVCVGYNESVLIDGISIDVKPGQTVVLIGPNGAGKSTVLKTVTGELKALGGKISVLDQDFSKLKEREIAHHVSMLMTEKVHPELMTCRDVIATGRFPYTGHFGILSEQDLEEVQKAAKTVHAEDILDKDFRKISDGQRQRVMLGRAIAQDTEIIVLDEPTSFLDMFYKLDLLKIIKNLARVQKKAVIMSLHELDLVKMVADVVVCIDGHRVVKSGSVDEIFAGNFIQKLYGIKDDEFDPATGMLKLKMEQSVRDCKGRDSGCGPLDRNEGAEDAGTLKSPAPTGNAQKKAKVIMVQGTMSNAGKSLLVAGLCRIFKQDGFKAAPFKSQNMALNSFITKEGLEMGRAQVMQAEAAGIECQVCMNPILLKPTSDKGSQVIVNGEVIGNMTAREYFAWKKNLKPEIVKAFKKLEEQADIIVIEGAGSPAEINLRENDIVNMGMAEMVDAPVLLAGDIDRGGVFAQLLGTIQLLAEEEKNRVKGLIINKFRGDKSLLDSGIEMLEAKCGIPVTGVIPYMNVKVDDEDSLSGRLESENRNEGFWRGNQDGINGEQKSAACLVKIGVIRFPHISNFTDFNVFDLADGVAVEYVTAAEKVSEMDMIILPGSKNTIGDLKWLRESGLEASVKKYAENGGIVFGICGGYQMLGKSISDPDGVEEGGEIRGMELLDLRTVLRREKVRTQVSSALGKIEGELGMLSGMQVSGYEIHMGETIVEPGTEKMLCGAFCGNVYGSYLHGFFDEGNIALAVAKKLAQKKGVSLKTGFSDYRAFKEKQYDMLADEIRKNLDMKAVYAMLREAAI